MGHRECRYRHAVDRQLEERYPDAWVVFIEPAFSVRYEDWVSLLKSLARPGTKLLAVLNDVRGSGDGGRWKHPVWPTEVPLLRLSSVTERHESRLPWMLDAHHFLLLARDIKDQLQGLGFGRPQ